MNFSRIFLIVVFLISLSSNHIAQTKQRSTIGKPTGVFFALSVADLDALSKWYQDKLGFQVLTSGEAPNKIAKFAILQSEGAIIEMIQHRDAKPMSVAAPSVKGAHQIHGIFKVGMLVEDIDGLHRRLKDKEVAIAYELMPAKDVPLRSFSIRDGEGNLVQFFGK